MATRAQILITAVDQTKAALQSATAGINTLAAQAKLATGVLAGLGVGLSVAGLMALGKEAIDTADDMNDMAQRTGVSVESLSTLGAVAEQTGGDVETLGKGFKGLSVNLLNAANGSDEAVGLFRQLGVAFKDTNGQLRSSESVLMELADRFAAMPDGPEKAALAVKVFGKAGIELIPLLNQGSAAIKEQQERFRELGYEISGDLASKADDFNDKLVELQKAFKGLVNQVVAAAVPALTALVAALSEIGAHSDELKTALTLLVEVIGVVLVAAVYRYVAALVAGKVATLAAAAATRDLTIAGLLGAKAWEALTLAFRRFLPVALAVAAIEIAKKYADVYQSLRESSQAVEDFRRTSQKFEEVDRIVDELVRNGVLSLESQLKLARIAAENLAQALPATAKALQSIGGAAITAGEAIRTAIEAEAKKADEAVKTLSADYKQASADIKAEWDARLQAIEDGYKRQEFLAANARQSERQTILSSSQLVTNVDAEKLRVVDAATRQMEESWRRHYTTAVQLARASGQNIAQVEREALDARIALYRQQEQAYRSTIDRLIAEERRHLDAARSAEQERLNLRLSVEDRIRELSRRGMDEYSAYIDKQKQIDEKQAAAREALQRGDFERAKKLAEESMQLAEATASEVTKQVELNTNVITQKVISGTEAMSGAVIQRIEQHGQSFTQTLVSGSDAAKNAISQLKESADIADQALAGMGNAHTQAAQRIENSAQSAKQQLASVSDELQRLREQASVQASIKLSVDLSSAQTEIDRMRALLQAQAVVVQIQADAKAAEASVEKLKAGLKDQAVLLQAQVDVSKVMTSIDSLKALVARSGVQIGAVASFDQPRQQLERFALDARTVLSTPTEARHTPQPDLSRYRAAINELQRPTSSTHTVYVRQIQQNALGGLIQKFAEGGAPLAQAFQRVAGRISGPGTETSDSIPAMLSHGEFVIRAASVRRFGAAFFEALNAGFLPAALPRFADGGLVAQAARASAQTAPARDVVDVRLAVGDKTYTVQSSRGTAKNLADALRELSRGR